MINETTRQDFRLNTLQGKNRTLANQVYGAIKEAILSLELKPGTPLVEDELAEQLGTSKTPVRDALVKLEQDSLVIRVPYKGTYVSELSLEDAEEIFELRGALEGLAARLAIPSISPEELRQAEAFLASADTALEQGDLVATSEFGEQFHKLLYKNAANKRLILFLQLLDDQLYRLRKLSNKGAERLKKSAVEHRRILDAIKQQDYEAVEAAFRDHHRSVLDDLIHQAFSEKVVEE